MVDYNPTTGAPAQVLPFVDLPSTNTPVTAAWLNHLDDVLDDIAGASGRIPALQTDFYLNVQDFGALGNNSANDTTAIQNAINAAAAQNGRIVYFPPGTYLISVPLVVKDKVRLVGASRDASFIKPGASFTGNMLVRFGDGTVGDEGIVFGATTEWLQLDCDDRVNVGVFSSNVQELGGVFNCVITKFRDKGIQMTDGRYFAIDGAEIFGSVSGWNYGIHLVGPAGPITINRVTVNSNSDSVFGTAGLYFQSTRVTVRHFHGEKCNDSIRVGPDGYGVLSGVDATTGVSGHAVRIQSDASGGLTCIDVDSINDQLNGRTFGNTPIYCVSTAGGNANFTVDDVGTALAKGSVTGSRGGNAALASLLTVLASQGIITNNTTA